jgi:uncharacterized protein
MAEWKRPLPTIVKQTEPYWAAAREGKLLLQLCGGCKQYQVHYRSFCCFCWSGEVEDIFARGTGTVFTYTVVHRNRAPGFAEAVPYVAALVELSEGVKVLTNIVNCEPERVHIGLRVRVSFMTASDEIRIPVFEPDQDADSNHSSSEEET